MSEYVFLKRELDAYPFSFFLLIVSCMVIIALFMAWKDKSTRGIEVSAWILIIVAVMSLFENVGIVLVIPDPPLWLFNVCMIITCIVTALVSSRFLMKSTKKLLQLLKRIIHIIPKVMI